MDLLSSKHEKQLNALDGLQNGSANLLKQPTNGTIVKTMVTKNDMDCNTVCTRLTGYKASSSQEAKRFPQYLAALFATLGMLSGGAWMGWTSPALSLLSSPNSTIPVSTEEMSWVGSLFPLGALIGAIPSGFLAEKFGRKFTMIIITVPLLGSWVLAACANSIGMIYAARVIAGFSAAAMTPAVQIYTAEIAEDSVRGALGSCMVLMMTIGILFAYVVGSLVSYFWLGLICAIVPVMYLITFIWMPESPHFLLAKNKKEKAVEALQWLRGTNYDVSRELGQIQGMIYEVANNQGSFKDMITSRTALKALVITLGVMFFQQFSGASAIIFYTVQIFTEAGGKMSPFLATVIVGIVQFLATFASAYLVDRAGRRVLLIISDAAMAVCLCTMGIYFHFKDNGTDVSMFSWLPVVALAAFIIAYSIGFGPIPWVIMAEVFPQNIKGPASSIAVAWTWVLIFAVSKLFPTLEEAIGQSFTFWTFCCICLLGIVFVATTVPETKGKSLDEIQKRLQRKSNKPTNDAHERLKV